MKKLLDKGVDPNVRLMKKVWYQEYNFPLLGVDEIGATPFWRAAYASDVEAMKLLVAYGADPNIRTKKIAGRGRFGRLAGMLRATGGLALDLALPRLCAGCRTPVGGDGLCATCWSKLSFM